MLSFRELQTMYLNTVELCFLSVEFKKKEKTGGDYFTL